MLFYGLFYGIMTLFFVTVSSGFFLFCQHGNSQAEIYRTRVGMFIIKRFGARATLPGDALSTPLTRSQRRYKSS